MKEIKDRLDDALAATRAAVQEGVVPGGGTAFIKALPSLKKVEPTNDDEQIGIDIVKKAIEAPLRQIVENAGLEGSIIVHNVKEAKKDK